MRIETGDPVVLVDAVGMEDYGLKAGDKGWANSVAVIPGDSTYVFFLPEGSKSMVVIGADRLEVDQEAKDKGIELNQDTIQG